LSDDLKLCGGTCIGSKTVVVRITDDQVVVSVNGEAAGTAIAVVRCGPGGAEVIAVAVEHLDSGGVIDNVKPVVRIDGDGTRPNKFSILDPPTTPDPLRRRMRIDTPGGAQCDTQAANNDNPRPKSTDARLILVCGERKRQSGIPAGRRVA